MDSHQENYGMSSFPELDNLIDTAQIQAEQLLDQPISMDEGMDSKIIIGMTTVGLIGAIAIVSFGLYHCKNTKDMLYNCYRSVAHFINERTN